MRAEKAKEVRLKILITAHSPMATPHSTHTDTYCSHFQTVGVVIWHPLHAVSFIRYTVKYRRKTPKVASLIV